MVARQGNLVEQAQADSVCLWNHVRCQAGVCSGSSVPHHRAAEPTEIPGKSEFCRHDLLLCGRDLQGVRNPPPGGTEFNEVALGQGELCQVHGLV